MEIQLRRFSSQQDSTLGLFYVDNEWECFSLEDEFRPNKVKGETRIPAGKYEIKKREEDSKLTLKYRDKYPWFDYHLQLQDVPGFDFVYIHVGNKEAHTDGCILIGDQAVNNSYDEKGNKLLSSGPAFERVYKIVSLVLSRGEKVTIEITDL